MSGVSILGRRRQYSDDCCVDFPGKLSGVTGGPIFEPTDFANKKKTIKLFMNFSFVTLLEH